MTIEAICFDLDDTLYDYLRYAKSGLEETGDYLEAVTGRKYHAELFDIYFEEGITEGTFDVLAERYGFPPERIDEMIETYHSATGPLEPYPETESVLVGLGDKYRLGCIADGREGHMKLRRLGIREYFDEAFVTTNFRQSKSDPGVFRHALSELSVSPRAAVYVGDDPRSDFRVPNELGMATVRIRRGRYTEIEPTDEAAIPDHEIQKLDEVLDIVSSPPPAEQQM